MTANRSMPSAAATLETRSAADPRSRPGSGVEPPYPGRSYDTQRRPSRSAAGKRGAGGEPRIRRPVMPEHGKFAVPLVRACVVDVEDSIVAQLQVELVHHSPLPRSRSIKRPSERADFIVRHVVVRASAGTPLRPQSAVPRSGLRAALAAARGRGRAQAPRARLSDGVFRAGAGPRREDVLHPLCVGSVGQEGEVPRRPAGTR